MNKNKGSMTALVTAFMRGYHAKHDASPIFDDFLAMELFTKEEQVAFVKNLAEGMKFLDPQLAALPGNTETGMQRFMESQTAPITLSRSQYTENSLKTALNHGTQQYVILGAGLETFAFREKTILQNLEVYEVDHPATQAMKLDRIARAGWQKPLKLHFVPIDFQKENLAKVLEKSPYNRQFLSFFSWLGVSYYLPKTSVLATLRTIAQIAPKGSTIIFDYIDEAAFIPETTSQRLQRMQSFLTMAGEPMITGFNPKTLAKELKEVGLQLEENLNPKAIEKRFFQGRRDGYHAYEHFYFARAMV